MGGTVHANVHAGVATLTLDSAGRLNAFDVPMVSKLRERLESAAADPAARCVVLAGRGNAFCAGADLSSLPDASAGPAAFADLTLHFHAAIEAIVRMQKPVLAAVNGVAAGGGFSLALACDLRIGSETARLKAGYLTLGVVPDGGATWTLPRLAGPRAASILLLDEALDARAALSAGLLDRVVPVEAFTKEVESLAARLAAGPRHALGQTKRLLREGAAAAFEEQLSRERAAIVAAGRTAEFAEGLAAFREKRPPGFGSP
ncbi:MAG TPA: enoyl-CoA hydratase-related protein [Candidatus Thermoplasmatota archaeon]|nr:enoyl-CoA hydratase-related protein [Candidatus Thermoplasmatota archaeon]